MVIIQINVQENKIMIPQHSLETPGSVQTKRKSFSGIENVKKNSNNCSKFSSQKPILIQNQQFNIDSPFYSINLISCFDWVLLKHFVNCGQVSWVVKWRGYILISVLKKSQVSYCFGTDPCEIIKTKNLMRLLLTVY